MSYKAVLKEKNPLTQIDESYEYWEDKYVKVRIAKNKMFAYLSLFPPATGDRKVTFEEALGVITRAGIVYGIDKEKVRKICEADELVKDTVIAQGTPAKKGKDAAFKYLFDKSEKGAKADEKGSMDFHEINLIKCVKEGEPLIQKIPYTNGEEGMNIVGDVIPAIHGADKLLPISPNTVVSSYEPNFLNATCAGEVVVKAGRVEVNPTKSIGSDIDFSTGNIHFTGSLYIGGNVKSGFLVESEGSIEIRGVVEDSQVVSHNSIVVRSGFAGKGKGIIKANGDVQVRFVQNQTIWSGGSITIGGESLHANLTASKKIIVKGGKAALIGGICMAGELVEVGTLGSEAGAWTVIKVGQDPTTARHLGKVKKELKRLVSTYEKVKKNLYTLYLLKMTTGVLSPKKQFLLNELEKVQASLPEQIESLRVEKDELEKNLTMQENARVIVHKKVYPNVRVEFGDQSLSTDSEMGRTVFMLKDEEVIATS